MSHMRYTLYSEVLSRYHRQRKHPINILSIEIGRRSCTILWLKILTFYQDLSFHPDNNKWIWTRMMHRCLCILSSKSNASLFLQKGLTKQRDEWDVIFAPIQDFHPDGSGLVCQKQSMSQSIKVKKLSQCFVSITVFESVS